MTDDVITRLTPQMRDYQRLGAEVDWRPYLMFFHHPNFQSVAITTDRHGFRPTHDHAGRRVTLDDTAGLDCNLLVGNSVSFGVGATTDATALSSRLSARSGETWLNFGGRAFGAMQELMLFQSYRYRLGQVRRVVLFSGLNDLYLYYAPKMFDETFGIFFYSEFFNRAMEQAASRPTGKRALLATLLRPLYGDRIDYGRVRPGELARQLLHPQPAAAKTAFDLDKIITDRRPGRQAIIDMMSRRLEMWKALSIGLGFELIYALQPMQPWAEGPAAAEETALLAEYDRQGGRWNAILRMVLDADHHRWYTGALAGTCQRLGVPFIDLNTAIPRRGHWLFTDRVHLTDIGQDTAAQVLLDFVHRHYIETT